MFEVRAATPSDYLKIQDLIRTIYEEYGERLCLENADGDLIDLQKSYRDKGGDFVVLTDEAERILASCAYVPTETQGVFMLKRMYMNTSIRGGGWADKLLLWAERESRRHGAHEMVLWSDVRFERAHQFYQKHGYSHTGTKRKMFDGYTPYEEFWFVKELV